MGAEVEIVSPRPGIDPGEWARPSDPEPNPQILNQPDCIDRAKQSLRGQTDRLVAIGKAITA